MSVMCIKRTFGLMFLMLAVSCTSSEPPMVKQLEKSIAAAETVLTEIETQIKKAPEQNQGLLIKLNQDKELAISRLERLKENLTSLAPHKKLTSPKNEGEGSKGGH